MHALTHSLIEFKLRTYYPYSILQTPSHDWPFHFTYTHAATPLTLLQGRILGSDIDILSVVGIATVEISGGDHERPTYYLDCISNQNNGTGLRWTRQSVQHRFEVEMILSGTPGIRMLLGGINSGDLDIYTCSDLYSGDIASVNITSCEYNSILCCSWFYVVQLKNLQSIQP